MRTFRRAKIHGNAMLHHFVLLQNLIQDTQRSPTIDHEVFRDISNQSTTGLRVRMCW